MGTFVQKVSGTSNIANGSGATTTAAYTTQNTGAGSSSNSASQRQMILNTIN